MIACSSSDSLRYENKSPRGISAINVTNIERAKAYRTAEIHCAKYSKVTRLQRSTKQPEYDENQKLKLLFECVKPSKRSKRR